MLKDILPQDKKQCPKCNGLLMFARDHYGPYLDCTRCGKHIDLGPPPAKQAPGYHQAPVPTVRDSGCDESPSCLTCPLPFCKYENRRAHRELVAKRAASQKALPSRLPAPVHIRLHMN